jgi:hypothetical protein
MLRSLVAVVLASDDVLHWFQHISTLWTAQLLLQPLGHWPQLDPATAKWSCGRCKGGSGFTDAISEEKMTDLGIHQHVSMPQRPAVTSSKPDLSKI